MFQLLITNLHEYCDAPRPWGLYFQDSAAPQMEGLVELHDNIMFYLIIILFGVGWILTSVIRNYASTRSPISHKYLNHGTLIELVWTITPALILILIAFPSFKLLYLMDEVSDPAMSVLAEGNQFLLNDGLKFYILNKIKDTSYLALLFTGQVNNILSLQTKSKNTKNTIDNHMFHTKVKAANRIGPHNHDVISVIVGSLLRDCYANRSVEGTRFAYKQSIVHKDYLFWLFDFFHSRGYCSNLEPRMYTRRLKKGDQVIEYYGYEFNTFTFRSFNWIQKMFYTKGKKVVSLEIEKYLTPLALAVWLMDDGGFAKPGTRISANSFKLEEVEFLAKVLKSKFDLDCTVQKIGIIDQYSIYIKGSSIPTLRQLVLPYVHPSMLYKLGL